MKTPPGIFGMLLESLNIETIQPMRVVSERIGDLPSGGCEVQLEYRQGFADGDPIRDSSATLVFRLKCELVVSCENNPVFSHQTTFVIRVAVKDESVYEKAWADPETRSLFMDSQLKKTIWPFFREHVHSAMTRLGMPPVVLPWIL